MNVPHFVNSKNSTKITTTLPPQERHGDEDVANHFSKRILRSEMAKRNPRKSKNREGRRDDGGGARASAANPGWLYGIHAVSAALRNPERRVSRLVATTAGATRLADLLSDEWKPEILDRDGLSALLPPGAVHQGVALLAASLSAPALEDLIARATGTSLLVLLDQVTDPQNVGAIMRSAAAFGADAVIMQDRHAPPMTGALAKAASGAAETLPLVRVTNLVRALEMLKDGGYWSVGLDGAAETPLSEARLDGKLTLVMGAEDSGLRRLTAENCDILARLPTQAGFGTLNVAAASAAALYECARQRTS